MATDITLRSVKAASLTYAEMDQNWESLAQTVDAITADYTILITDQNKILEGNIASGVITLPPVANALATDTDSFRVTVKNVHSTSLLVAANGGEVIEGFTSVALLEDEVAEFALNSDASEWSLVGFYGPNLVGITATSAELNYSVGVTSGIQGQLDAKQPEADGLTDIAGLIRDDGNIIVGDGTNWVAEAGDVARTSLGLGSADLVTHQGLTITDELFLDGGGDTYIKESAANVVQVVAGAVEAATFQADGIHHNADISAFFGAGDALQIFNDGTNTRIHNRSGLLIFNQQVTSSEIHIQSYDSLDVAKSGIVVGGAVPAVKQYYNGLLATETIGTGLRIGGTLDIFDDGAIRMYSNKASLDIRGNLANSIVRLQARNTAGNNQNIVTCGVNSGIETSVQLNAAGSVQAETVIGGFNVLNQLQVGGVPNFVSQGVLKTGTTETSASHLGNATSSLTLDIQTEYPLGQQIRTDDVSRMTAMYGNSMAGATIDVQSTSYTVTYVQWSATYIHIDSVTDYLQARYILASPPFMNNDGQMHLFMYAVIKADGTIQKACVSESPPWPQPKYSVEKGKKIITSTDLSSGRPVLVKRELTMDDTLENMDVRPHPFTNLNLKPGESLVMLDSVSDVMAELLPFHQAQTNETALWLLNNNYLTIGNDSLNRQAPKGMNVVDVKWKNTI